MLHKIHNKIKALFCMMLICFALFLPTTETVKADLLFNNEGTGYQAKLVDNANLLDTEEENAILDIMMPSTEFGNIYFLTEDYHSYASANSLANATYRDTFGDENGVIFVIDMDTRMLWISGFGKMQYVITDNYCDTITDNVYRYASDEDYFTCAGTALTQINSLLNGKNIPQPMKYVCNFLISVIFALIINYFVVIALSKKKKASLREVSKNIYSRCGIGNTSVQFVKEKRVYNPPSSSSSGGGGGGGGGGSSGGGHSF